MSAMQPFPDITSGPFPPDPHLYTVLVNHVPYCGPELEPGEDHTQRRCPTFTRKKDADDAASLLRSHYLALTLGLPHQSG